MDKLQKVQETLEDLRSGIFPSEEAVNDLIDKALAELKEVREGSRLLDEMAEAIWTAIKKHELGDKCFERATSSTGDFKEHWRWYQKNKKSCIEAQYSTLATAEKAALAIINVIKGEESTP